MNITCNSKIKSCLINSLYSISLFINTEITVNLSLINYNIYFINEGYH